jgi:hypothetical protein
MKDKNKVATQAPSGVERAKAGLMSGPMVPPISVTDATTRPTTMRAAILTQGRPRPAMA